jgi:RNA polymerase sigma factor (sigma-70 family)
MTHQPDSLLLREYAARRSQEAFNELVSRHSGWVYSAALRCVRDAHVAEDVAQAVFIVMANKAGSLGEAPLHRWLFKVTRYAAANAIRARARRDKYERLAAMASSESQEVDEERMWQDIAPVLDESISKLGSKDRDALLLRFYQQKCLAEVGGAMGVSEGAAKVRVLRAVEKLRGMLRRRGIAVPAVALPALMLTHTTHAAPASIAGGFVPAASSVQVSAISKGVTSMLISTKVKMAVGVLTLVGLSAGTGIVYMAATAEVPASPPVAIAPAAPAAPTATTPIVGIDPQVVPLLTARTDLLISIDLTRLDVNALADDIHRELGKMNMDAQSAGKIDGLLQMGAAAGKQWIANFEKAGGTTVYLMSRSEGLRSQGSGQGLSLTAMDVFPTDSPESAQRLMAFLNGGNGAGFKIVGNCVVDDDAAVGGGPRAGQADPRPALIAGLSSAGDSPVRISVNPAQLKNLMPKLMSSGGMTANIVGNEWDNVEYVSFNLVLPPAENPALVVSAHHKDAATAQEAAKQAMERISGQGWAHPSAGATPLTQRMQDFMASEKFTVNGSDVVGTMDLHAYWRLLFTALKSAPGFAAASRP